MKKKLFLVALLGLLGLGVITAAKAEDSRSAGNVLGTRQENQEDVVNGVKLRGDGSVDDNSIVSKQDNMTNTVKLRGNGSVDDNFVAGRGNDDIVNGVKLRGDGSVDDNSASHLSGRDRGGHRGED